MAKTLIAETNIVIQAPIEHVWQTMLDVERYEQWNPFVVRVAASGDTNKVGTAMRFTVQWHDGGKATSNEVVKEALPPYADENGIKRAYWAYMFESPLDKLGLVHAIRYQWLEEHADGLTIYKTREVFTGLLINFLPLRKVQAGFERQAAALKHRAETWGSV